ncbi:MAG: hypothetical protein HKP02_14065 [Xanthomonadales bacterium]|nr:hypothetical protein [Xanthomonadales bacterium]
MTVDQAKRRKAAARWHRRIALFVAAWLAALALSGVLVNHAHDLGLDRKPLATPLQRWVYGIESEGEDFCETAPITGAECGHVFGRLALPAGELLLAAGGLFLLDGSGQLIERLAASQLGLVSLQAAYREADRFYFRDAERTVVSDPDLLNPAVLSAGEAAALDSRDWLVRDDSATAITWERLLLDLHAARFLGPFAKAFNDLVALLIIVLAVSGYRLHRLKRNGNGQGPSV